MAAAAPVGFMPPLICDALLGPLLTSGAGLLLLTLQGCSLQTSTTVGPPPLLKPLVFAHVGCCSAWLLGGEMFASVFPSEGFSVFVSLALRFFSAWD